MAVLVSMGATLQCSFGVTPSTLSPIPKGPPVTSTNMQAATVMDFTPGANIPPFGMCTTLSNPAVASATTAAQGVLTPVPCMPVTVAPWAPGSATVMINNFSALNNSSTLNCTWGGVITISSPGQTKAMVP